MYHLIFTQFPLNRPGVLTRDLLTAGGHLTGGAVQSVVFERKALLSSRKLPNNHNCVIVDKVPSKSKVIIFTFLNYFQ